MVVNLSLTVLSKKELAVNNDVINQIKKVLSKYFEVDECGNPNKDYDECFSAQDAIDEIRDIVNQY